jgi:hypothetical protein
MRHLLVAAALLLAALIVTLGTATVLESMATSHREPAAEPYVPGAPAPPPSPMVRKPPPPEQSRSLSLLIRHS